MQITQNLSESDCRWFNLIQQCRTSGKTDYQWLQENNISSPTFYYHIKQLRKKACEIPQSIKNEKNEVQEVVPLCVDEPGVVDEPPAWKGSIDSIAVRLNMQGISVEISNTATQEIIQNTLTALRCIC